MKRTNHPFPLLRPILLPGLLVLALATVVAGAPGPGETVTVVHRSRPLAALLDELEGRLGAVITYEDPVWVYAGDLSDVTREVAPDAEKGLQSGAPPVLVPVRGDLGLTLPAAKAGELPDPATAVQTAIDAHWAAGNPGRFRLIRDGAGLHVVPAQVKDRAGRWTSPRPLLDTRIDLPAEERTRLDTLRALTIALGSATKTRIGLGMVAMPGRKEKLTLGASHEPARQVLAKVLAGLAPQASWRLYYDRTLDQYYLNVHYVAAK